MTHRGGFQHNFMLKYAPLRLKGSNQSPSSNDPRGYSPGAAIGLSSRSFLSSTCTDSSTSTPSKTHTEAAVTEPESSCDILNSSLENITSWCQRQESRNGKLQNQLNAYVTEIADLKSNLSNSSTVIEQLHATNKKLRESQEYLEHELEVIQELYREVKYNLTDATQALEEIGKDRESWLSHFDNTQRNRYEKELKSLSDLLEKTAEEKNDLAEKMCDVQKLSAQLSDVSSEREGLIHQLQETKTELDSKIRENSILNGERSKFEREWINLKESFDKLLLERTAEVIEESRQEKIRITALVKELNEQKETSLVLQNEYQQAMTQLNELKQLEYKEPRELLKIENESCKSQIRQFREVNSEIEREISTLRAKLASSEQVHQTNEQIKLAFQNLSKENEELKDRQILLEKQLLSSNEALVESMGNRDHLEKTAVELNVKLEYEIREKTNLESKVEELLQEIAMNKETAATQQNTFEDITRQLTVSQERNQELELELKENLQRLETAHGQEEKLRQSNADLEKAVGELKCELMAKTVELQYKDKKLEEIIQQWENSKNAADETVQAEADAQKSKTKTEIEKLKSNLNLKNLELESVNQQLQDAKLKISSAEEKIVGLEMKIQYQKKKFKSERAKDITLPSNNENPIGNLDAASRPDADKHKISTKSHSILKSSREASTNSTKPDTHIDAFDLFQRAKAIGAAEDLKRISREHSYFPMRKPPSPTSVPQAASGKKRRLDCSQSSQSRLSHLKDDVASESPVLRNKSGVVTTRVVSNKRPTTEFFDIDQNQTHDTPD